MRNLSLLFLPAFLLAAAAPPAMAQGAAPAAPPPQFALPQIVLPPATRLEGFAPVAGAILITGSEDIGVDSSGVQAISSVSVEAREMRDPQGGVARGLVVDVIETGAGKARSYVDVDEIPDLIKNLDTLLGIIANPAPAFEHFEARYMTRGELAVAVLSNSKGVLRYSVQAGRIQTARTTLDQRQMQTLRGLFVTALQKLNAAGR